MGVGRKEEEPFIHGREPPSWLFLSICVEEDNGRLKNGVNPSPKQWESTTLSLCLVKNYKFLGA